MVAFDPDPQVRWLFCMTHPDDEIAICAWIRRLVDAGAEVWLSWTHSTPIRHAEALAAARRLGVPRDRLFFHEGTDANCCDEMDILLSTFRAMIGICRPDRIACGAFEQGHIDHDTTNFLVHQVFKGPIYEIPFYYSYLTRLPRVNRFENPEGEEVLKLEREQVRFKIDYAKGFPSQRVWVNMIFANLQAMITGDGPLGNSERMRLQGRTDFRKPQHSPGLSLQIEESETWARWLAAVDRFEAMG